MLSDVTTIKSCWKNKMYEIGFSDRLQFDLVYIAIAKLDAEPNRWWKCFARPIYIRQFRNKSWNFVAKTLYFTRTNLK